MPTAGRVVLRYCEGRRPGLAHAPRRECDCRCRVRSRVTHNCRWTGEREKERIFEIAREIERERQRRGACGRGEREGGREREEGAEGGGERVCSRETYSWCWTLFVCLCVSVYVRAFVCLPACVRMRRGSWLWMYTQHYALLQPVHASKYRACMCHVCACEGYLLSLLLKAIMCPLHMCL